MLSDYARHLRRIGRSPGTVRIRICHAKQLLEQLDPATATEEDLVHFLDTHAQWAPATRVAVIASIHSLYAWMLRAEIITSRPDEWLRYPRVPRRAARIAGEAQIAAALPQADDSTEAMIRLGAECGLRVHEIAKAHSDDRDGDFLHVVGKGGVQRQVHLTPELVRLLDGFGTGYYFPGRFAGHTATTTVRRRITGALGSNPHSLRHRAATTVYSRTKDLRLTQEFLGHARPETTAIYVHVERDDLRRAGEAARIAA